MGDHERRHFLAGDVSATPAGEIPDREIDCTWWNVASRVSRQARVRVPASQAADPEHIAAALNYQVARVGYPVVVGWMVATKGLELFVGYDG